MYIYFSIKKQSHYTMAGVDLTTHSSNLLGGRRQAETLPLDHAGRATIYICLLIKDNFYITKIIGSLKATIITCI
jgi:hypothetical protein